MKLIQTEIKAIETCLRRCEGLMPENLDKNYMKILILLTDSHTNLSEVVELLEEQK